MADSGIKQSAILKRGNIKIHFTGPITSGLNLEQKNNGSIFISLAFWSLHIELKEKCFSLLVCPYEFQAIALA